MLACLPLATSAQVVDSTSGTSRDAAAYRSAANERVVHLQWFRPDFYAIFRPKTALDIVLATPGFELDQGAAGRGLNGAVGNVLINGVRPPVKATPITQVLSSIPADEVKSVILVPAGSGLNLDMAGHSMLLYLVTVPKSGAERSLSMNATDSGRQGNTRTFQGEVRVSRPKRLYSANLQDSRLRTVTLGGLAAPLVGQAAVRRVGGSALLSGSTRLGTMAQWRLGAGQLLQVRLNLSRMTSSSQPLSLDTMTGVLDAASASAQHGGDVATEFQWPFAAGRGELALTHCAVAATAARSRRYAPRVASATAAATPSAASRRCVARCAGSSPAAGACRQERVRR